MCIRDRIEDNLSGIRVVKSFANEEIEKKKLSLIHIYAECVGAVEILYMATAGGAHAMQLEDCDRLAVGKKADIVMIDLNQPNMQPENNIVKNLVYSGSKQNVKMTMINGKVLYEDNHFEIGFDPKEIYQRANAIIGRMK